MLLIVHIPLNLRIESIIIIWQLIVQLNLMRMWFQTLFIIEPRLNFGTIHQSKLKQLLGLLILVNCFPFLDNVHQDILFHARVKLWKIRNCWGCYELVFLRSLGKFYEKIYTVQHQTHTSVCLGLCMVNCKPIHALPEIGFCTALYWWIETSFPCRVG